MTTSFLSTKWYIPTPRPNAVKRRRLTARLSEGFYRKLTLISAPAGYGKTSLASEWLADCGRPVAWLSLEEGDGELTRFMTVMMLSLRTLEKNLGEGILAVLQAPQPPPAESILEALLHELEAIPVPFVFVLDDYHAANSKPVDEALAFLIDRLPSRMHLVVTTREDPGIPLARLRARDQLTELRLPEMRFTLAESEDFLNRCWGLNLSMDTIASLESRTEGWIAGLHLAAISISGERDAERILQSYSGNHRFVLDYLIEEVLQRQPAAIQAFLLRTSIVDRLCGSLCEDILLDPEVSGQQTLMELDRNNLFVVPLDDERRWYRYHHLFADTLRRRLRESLDASEAAELHRRASVWHENNGYDIEAFRHATEAQDIERASRLLEGNGMPLHLRGAAGLALKWLETLPAAELEARPALWVYYGSALLIAGKPTGVEDKLQAAEAALAVAEQDGAVRDLIGLIAATRATLASFALTSQLEGVAERRLQAAEAAMRNAAPEDMTDELVGLIVPSSGAPMSGLREIDRVIVQARRALEFLRPDYLPVRTAAAWLLGTACQRGGLPDAAREAYREVITNSGRMGHRLMAAMALIGLGQLEEAEEEDRLHKAADYYQEALSLCGDMPLPALREAQLGLERALHPQPKSKLIEPLSKRELEVLELIIKGLSNRDIGEKLHLALDTVKGHNRRIFEKLHVQRRTEAVARASELKLFPDSRKPH